MPELSDDIAAYERIRADLEAKHLGKWVLVHNCGLIGIFDTFEAAAEGAVQKYGRGPYLIHQVGSSSMPLPASVMYRPLYA